MAIMPSLNLKPLVKVVGIDDIKLLTAAIGQQYGATKPFVV